MDERNGTTTTPDETTAAPEMDWEVLVVGSSYAGLSTALTLGRTRRATLVVGEGGPRNEAVQHTHNLLTRDGASPSVLLAEAVAQLEPYDSVQLESDRVRAITRIPGGFRAQVGPRTVTAAAVVLATGVNDDPLPVPGLADLWGRGVFTCPYCDGWEHRDQPLVALAPGGFGAHLASVLTLLSDDVTVCTSEGAPLPTEEQLADLPEGVAIERRSVVRVHGDGEHVTALELIDGTLLAAGALFGSTVSHPNSQLAVELGCEVDDDGFVRVDEMQATTVQGVWAVGDVTSHRRFQMAFSLASGITAASAITFSLLARRPAERRARSAQPA